MASHFKLYDGMGEVVPFNARYAYPTQANRAWKSLMKIPPKNGSKFGSNGSRTIRIELPAQSYLNCANTKFEFDLTFAVNAASKNVHMQNNAASWIKNARWLYGSLVGENIREYGLLVRCISEATQTNTYNTLDQSSLLHGMGSLTPIGSAYVNTRNYAIHSANPDPAAQIAPGLVTVTRRYEISIDFGLFQQNKLLPLKWMASQLAVEFELANYEECMSATVHTAGDAYEISNCAISAELLEFDGSYDAAFKEGLANGGVPIKFASWDTFTYSAASGSGSQTLLIPERNRSLKSAFLVLVPPPAVVTGDGLPYDSHACLQSSGSFTPATGKANGHLVSYQWRIGGKYYPAQPVVCGDPSKSNGAAEAYLEFEKALNINNDFRLSTALNTCRWNKTDHASADAVKPGLSTAIDWWVDADDQSNAFGPSTFVVSADFETSRGAEVSGLNGEEQNDIAVMLTYGPSTQGQSASCLYHCFIYYDALLILRDNNIVELIK